MDLHGQGSKNNMYFDEDPICKLNLKETSEFVKPFAVSSNNNKKDLLEVSTQKKHDFSSKDDSIKRSIEAPQTPGRPIFSFSVGNFSKKSLPSKWDDAEKWLVSGSSCNDSPVLNHGSSKQHQQQLVELCCKKMTEQNDMSETKLSERLRVNTAEKITTKVISGIVPLDHHHHYSACGFDESSASSNVLLKDKFTNEAKDSFPIFKCSEPMKEGFVFANNNNNPQNPMFKNASKNEVEHRDIGTEMTPLGSSTTSRCHTPFKCSSPARHNTPIDRSGPLEIPDSDSSSSRTLVVGIAHQLQLGTTAVFDSVNNSNWSSRDEEEEEISKSLRHFEMMSNECRKGVYDSRACGWDEDGKTNVCSRYQREEAKIQAWVNLENAKAEAESRKLEVKIQKMRSKLENKLMKRMSIVHRKAEEWKSAAQMQHSKQTKKAMNAKQKSSYNYGANKLESACCACFSCNNNPHY